jgi:hypothetical protein
MTTDFPRALFLIENGKALELVQSHMAEKERVAREVRELLKPLNVAEYWSSRDDGTAMTVRFAAAGHPDFTKPDRRGSRPKKGTEWAKRFAEQRGYQNSSTLIATAFNVPLSISYGRDGLSSGWRAIGYPFNECGFMWIKSENVYVMYVPDVAAEVRESEAHGFVVAEPAKSFSMQFEGCRRILPEEWDARVAQYKLKVAQEKQAEAATA